MTYQIRHLDIEAYASAGCYPDVPMDAFGGVCLGARRGPTLTRLHATVQRPIVLEQENGKFWPSCPSETPLHRCAEALERPQSIR